MPEMDGLTATKRIRELEARDQRSRVIIIGVTANAFAEDRIQCLEAGMDDYMSKPFSEEQLRQLLARWAPKATPAPVEVITALAPATPTAIASTPAAATAPAAIASPLGDKAVPVSKQAVSAAVDMSVLRGMQKSHPALVGRLVSTYLAYGPQAIQQLLAALVEEDVAALKMAAHSLKSSSGNIGANLLSDLCRDLELRLKTATTWDAGGNLASVADIETAFQAVAVSLGALQAELKATPAAPIKASA